jgi:hypothetical protein
MIVTKYHAMVFYDVRITKMRVFNKTSIFSSFLLELSYASSFGALVIVYSYYKNNYIYFFKIRAIHLGNLNISE